MAMTPHDVYRIFSAQDLAVASAGGAAVSTSLFSAQTYVIQVVGLGTVSSTAGIRVKIGNATEAPVASSTSDTLVPLNWVQLFKVTPGQRLSAIANNAESTTINVTQLID